LDGASTASDHGRIHFNNWGSEDQVLQATYVPSVTGKYAIQIVYGNAFNMVNTGITACVKSVEVIDGSNNLVVCSSVVTMPHLPDWNTWGDSSFAQASLAAGVPYRISIKDFYNMSYLARNDKYNFAGGSHVVNRANISGLKILMMEKG
jgi:hypothetical protein